jgi:hypothetical protein
MWVTVLFQPANLNMAVCLFGRVLGAKCMICLGVVAMQQLIA